MKPCPGAREQSAPVLEAGQTGPRAAAVPRLIHGALSRRTTARPPSSTTSCWGHAFCRLWQCTALRKASLARHCKTLDSGNLHRFQSQNPQRISSTTHLWQCTALRTPGCRFILESTRSVPERISGSTPRCSAPQSVNESSQSAQRSQSTMQLWQRMALHNPGLSESSQNPQRIPSTTPLWQCTALHNPGPYEPS